MPTEVVPAPDPVGSGSADLDSGEYPPSNTQSENKYAEADLDAQQDMALWAMWMVVVSAVSVAIAGIAVYLVYLTLREARRTTRGVEETLAVTHNIAERELRAWLTLKATLGRALMMEQGQSNSGLRIDALITVKNVGKSAARNVRIHARANNGALFNSEKFVFEYYQKKIEMSEENLTVGEILAPTEELTERHATMVFDVDLARQLSNTKKLVAPFVTVVATYRTVGSDDTLLYTAKAFNVAVMGDNGAFAINLNKLPIQTTEAGMSSMPLYAKVK